MCVFETIIYQLKKHFIMYHIAFMAKPDTCTGVNIQAASYSEAIQRFEKEFKNKEILYICRKDTLSLIQRRSTIQA
jgi:hypothetical protein